MELVSKEGQHHDTKNQAVTAGNSIEEPRVPKGACGTCLQKEVKLAYSYWQG